MRVLMGNKFLYLRGGTERVMFDLTAGLVERGHEVVPFAMRDDRNQATPWSRWFPPPRDYDAGGPGTKLRLAAASIWDRASRRALEGLLEEARPDLAHLHNIYHQLSPSILAALRAAGVPTVMTLHDYKLACPTYTLFRDGRPCTECVGKRVPWGAGVHRCHRDSRAESWLVSIESTLHRTFDVYGRTVDRFVSPSRFLADVMVRHGIPAARVEVIPNAPRDAAAPHPPRARSERPRVLYAGRLSREKGVDVLVEAARQVPDLELFVAGGGPLEDALRRSAEGAPRVHFLGHLGPEALAQERARAWAVAVPSVWYENAPLTVLEAYAAGRPVLASDHGGLVEMVEPGVTGWRVPPGDPAAWASALARVARDPGAAADLGRQARERLEQRYTFEPFLDAHLALYRSLV